MKRFNSLTLVGCGLVAAVVWIGSSSQANAAVPWPHPWPHPHPMPLPWHHPHHVYPIVVGPAYPIVVRTPYVAPVTVYSDVPSNPAPMLMRVSIVNPAATAQTLSFTIEGQRYDLAPGSRQEMQLPGVRTITFDRGGSFGRATYPLTDGAFSFKATEGGWDLVREPYAAAAVATR
jgi:hypothetical protein